MLSSAPDVDAYFAGTTEVKAECQQSGLIDSAVVSARPGAGPLRGAVVHGDATSGRRSAAGFEC